jgi:glycine/D-amino acid oxidase-like deaminating enzyme
VYVVIMGCGRVGSSLAASLDRLGHEVAVIDKDRQAFRRLPAEFSGRQVVGQGFHREVLVEAGVEGAQAFAAVSSGDNSNIIAARVARETARELVDYLLFKEEARLTGWVRSTSGFSVSRCHMRDETGKEQRWRRVVGLTRWHSCSWLTQILFQRASSSGY